MTAKTAHGEHATSPYVIVKMHTDAGLTGLGEATVSALWSGETQGTVLALIREYLAPALVGRDPRDITAIRRTMDFLVKLNPFTKSALEMACWDLAGKSAGLPVWQLLGGRVRDRVLRLRGMLLPLCSPANPYWFPVGALLTCQPPRDSPPPP